MCGIFSSSVKGGWSPLNRTVRRPGSSGYPVISEAYAKPGKGFSSFGKNRMHPVIRFQPQTQKSREISQFIKLTRDSEIVSRLQFSSCQTRYQRLASRLVDQATHPNVKLALEFIRDFPTEKLDRIGNDSRFQAILRTVKR